MFLLHVCLHHRRGRHKIPQELELIDSCDHLMWVLRTEPGHYGKAANALNLRPIFQPQFFVLCFILFFLSPKQILNKIIDDFILWVYKFVYRVNKSWCIRCGSPLLSQKTEVWKQSSAVTHLSNILRAQSSICNIAGNGSRRKHTQLYKSWGYRIVPLLPAQKGICF